jgi:hypothetical protein
MTEDLTIQTPTVPLVLKSSATGSQNRILVDVACNFVRHRVHTEEIEAQVVQMVVHKL